MAALAREFDILDSEGRLTMRRSRADVHRAALWHRAVHVWVVCPDTCRLLLGKRARRKSTDPGRWTCACGRVPAGEHSMDAAVALLHSEFSLKATPDVDLCLAFTLRCSKQIASGAFEGQWDNTIADVYILRLEEETPEEKVHADENSKETIGYLGLEDLQSALEERNEDFVLPANEEYVPRLVKALRGACEVRSAAVLHQRAKATRTALARSLESSAGGGGALSLATATASSLAPAPAEDDDEEGLPGGDRTSAVPRAPYLGVTCKAWKQGKA